MRSNTLHKKRNTGREKKNNENVIMDEGGVTLRKKARHDNGNDKAQKCRRTSTSTESGKKCVVSNVFEMKRKLTEALMVHFASCSPGPG